MAKKKTVMGDAKEAVKSLAGAALGAAAAGAAGVVAETMKQMLEGEKKDSDPAPEMEKVAAKRVANPVVTSSRSGLSRRKREKRQRRKWRWCGP